MMLRFASVYFERLFVYLGQKDLVAGNPGMENGKSR